MKVLVTGANGFVGAAATAQLAQSGYQTMALSRHRLAPSSLGAHITPICGTFEDLAQWQQALAGCDAVVHSAARVHQVQEASSDPLKDYRRVNVDHTLALARAAHNQGVKRFVFLSSIKVNGEQTAAHQPFLADDVCNPLDPYGISKYEAEQALLQLATETGLEVVIIRPPLVYGPGVKANFLSMMRWLQRGLPLPLGAIYNQRSLLGLGNLLDLINMCLTHPMAANQIFLASDGHDVSTTELLQRMAKALNASPRLVKVPQSWLEASAKLVGKPGMAQRLCGNLAVDISKTRDLLGWQPPVPLEAGLRDTAAHFLQSRA